MTPREQKQELHMSIKEQIDKILDKPSEKEKIDSIVEVLARLNAAQTLDIDK